MGDKGEGEEERGEGRWGEKGRVKNGERVGEGGVEEEGNK